MRLFRRTKKTPAGGHATGVVLHSDVEREAATVPPAGHCPVHTRAETALIDPTGGDPFMGGPVLIRVCAKCGRDAVIRPTENWNPNTAGPDCDWCGECDWCQNLHVTRPVPTADTEAPS